MKTLGSGRKKGTPNKDVEPLRQMAVEVGIDPFKILLWIAKGDWKALGYPGPTETKYTARGESYEADIITIENRRNAASDACQYLHAKRKSIEHEVVHDSDLNIIYKAEWSQNEHKE